MASPYHSSQFCALISMYFSPPFPSLHWIQFMVMFIFYLVVASLFICAKNCWCLSSLLVFITVALSSTIVLNHALDTLSSVALQNGEPVGSFWLPLYFNDVECHQSCIQDICGFQSSENGKMAFKKMLSGQKIAGSWADLDGIYNNLLEFTHIHTPPMTPVTPMTAISFGVQMFHQKGASIVAIYEEDHKLFFWTVVNYFLLGMTTPGWAINLTAKSICSESSNTAPSLSL